MMLDDFFQPTADDFGKAHFVFGSKSFCFAEKRIGNLHLCFYHDGILPTGAGCVNFSSSVHFRLSENVASLKPPEAAD